MPKVDLVIYYVKDYISKSKFFNRVNPAALLNFFLFVCFCLGIVTGKLIPQFPIFLTISLFSLALSCFFYRYRRIIAADIFILILFFSLGGLWHSSNRAESVDELLSREQAITLKVISLPKRGVSRNTLTAEISRIGLLRSKLKVKVADYTRSLNYLSSYRLKGKVSERHYYGHKYYSLIIKQDADLQGLPLGLWARFCQKTANYILGVLEENCSDQGYRFLSGVFLGRKELLAGEKKLFADAGVSHLLAISGLHLGLTSLILFFLLRFFNFRFRASLIVSLVFLSFYTFLTGAGYPTLRALIMYSVFCFSFLFKRKSNGLNSLALSGFIILFLDPSSLFTIGFQLSFVSVFAIIVSFRAFKAESVRAATAHYLKQIFFCSLFVTLFLTPLISYYFGKIYILSIFYNIILIPFFTFILGVNFILIVLSPVNFIAQSLGAILSLITAVFIRIVEFFGSIGLSSIDYTFSPMNIITYYLFLVGFLAFLLKLQSKTRPLTI